MKNVVRFISTKKIFIIAGIILVTVLYILISHKDSPATSASNASKKYYKCITIEEGDTLWDIANEYKTHDRQHREHEQVDECAPILFCSYPKIISVHASILPHRRQKRNAVSSTRRTCFVHNYVL